MKNYRAIIDRALDLCDPHDPTDLAATLESIAQTLRVRAQLDASDAAEKKRMAEVAPWFDETHPMNRPG